MLHAVGTNLGSLGVDREGKYLNYGFTLRNREVAASALDEGRHGVDHVVVAALWANPLASAPLGSVELGLCWSLMG